MTFNKGLFKMHISRKTLREEYDINTNLEKIADTLIQNPKYKNLDFDNLIEELEPIVRLYDFKDALYSTDTDSLVDKESEDYEMTDEYQNELTDEGLYADVTKLNKKYNLVNKELPELTGMGDIPLNWDEDYDFYDEDDCWKIYEEDDDINFIWTKEEWEKLIKNEEVYDELFDLSRYIIDDKISKWGDDIDAWFDELNKKFDTDFYVSNKIEESNHRRFSKRLGEQFVGKGEGGYRKFESINRSEKSWDILRITDSNTKRILKNCGLPEDYLFPKNKYVEFQGMHDFGRGYIDWIIVFEVNVADMIRTNKYLKDDEVTKTLKNLIDNYYEEYCDERNSDTSLLDDPEEFKKAKKYAIKVFNTNERILIRMTVKNNKIQATLEDNVGYGFDSFPGKQLDLSYKFDDSIDDMYIGYFKAVKDYIDKNF